MLFEYFEYILIFLIYGTRPILYKYIIPYIHVESIILISGVFYLMLAVFYIYFTKPTNFIRDVQIMNKNTKLHACMWLIAVTGLIATHYYLYLLKDSPVILNTALFSGYPLVTALIAYLFLNEVITQQQLIGMIVIIAGVTILNFGVDDY